jgi:hypothetical protein
METWDYKLPDSYSISGIDFQKDWNQTLIVKINEIALKIKADYPKRLVVASQLKPLIESLMYYEDEKIGTNYRVIFTENEMNTILVEGEQLYVLNFPKNYEKTTSII